VGTPDIAPTLPAEDDPERVGGELFEFDDLDLKARDDWATDGGNNLD
jgi:hypothetical protein